MYPNVNSQRAGVLCTYLATCTLEIISRTEALTKEVTQLCNNSAKSRGWKSGSFSELGGATEAAGI